MKRSEYCHSFILLQKLGHSCQFFAPIWPLLSSLVPSPQSSIGWILLKSSLFLQLFPKRPTLALTEIPLYFIANMWWLETEEMPDWIYRDEESARLQSVGKWEAVLNSKDEVLTYLQAANL